MRGRRPVLKERRIPGVVQLPGGVQLTAVAFKVVERHPDGTAKLFELLPGPTTEKEDIWYLFANEQTLRTPKKP